MTHDPVELVIFDCDGVLVDSERIAVQVDAQVFAKLGIHFTEAEIVERFVGCSAEDFDAAVEERLGRPLEPGWHREFTHLYDAAFAAGLTVIDGVGDVLERLGIPFCVASNNSHDGIRRNLTTTGLYGHFEGRVFCASDVARGKPAPDLFLHAARTLGVPRPAARWWRTARTASRRHERPACAPSATAAASPRPTASPARARSSSATCATSRPC